MPRIYVANRIVSDGEGDSRLHYALTPRRIHEKDELDVVVWGRIRGRWRVDRLSRFVRRQRQPGGVAAELQSFAVQTEHGPHNGDRRPSAHRVVERPGHVAVARTVCDRWRHAHGSRFVSASRQWRLGDAWAEPHT